MISRVAFFSLAIFYVVLGVCLTERNDFIDIKTLENAEDKYIFEQLFISLIMGISVAIWFKKIFPGAFQLKFKNTFPRLQKVFLYLLVCGFCFAINYTWLFIVNTIFVEQSRPSNLLIGHKYIKKKRSSSTYVLVALDKERSLTFHFKTSKEIFEEVELGETLSKNLELGCFGTYFIRQ